MQSILYIHYIYIYTYIYIDGCMDGCMDGYRYRYKISESMFHSNFGAENYLTIVFHSENLRTVFKISKILHLSLKWTKNDLFARRAIDRETQFTN